MSDVSISRMYQRQYVEQRIHHGQLFRRLKKKLPRRLEMIKTEFSAIKPNRKKKFAERIPGNAGKIMDFVDIARIKTEGGD